MAVGCPWREGAISYHSWNFIMTWKGSRMPFVFLFCMDLLLDMMLHEGGREIGAELGWPLAPRESLGCFTLRIDCVVTILLRISRAISGSKNMCLMWFKQYVFIDGYLDYYVCIPTSLPRS